MKHPEPEANDHGARATPDNESPPSERASGRDAKATNLARPHRAEDAAPTTIAGTFTVMTMAPAPPRDMIVACAMVVSVSPALFHREATSILTPGGDKVRLWRDLHGK